MVQKDDVDFPLVSVTITSYNTEQWIGNAIRSALDQDYGNLEVIVCDNCSSDHSGNIIKEFCSDKRVKYTRNEVNIGMNPNFEKVFFELSSGEYIVNLSSDDHLLDPSFISKAVRLTREHKEIVLVFGKSQSVNESTGKVSSIAIGSYYETPFRNGMEAFLDFAENPYFGWAGCFIKKSKLIELGIHFSDNVCSDIEFNLKLMLHGHVGYINSFVYSILVHETNATRKILTGQQYIDSRLNMFSGIINMYIDQYGENEQIQKWKNIVLQRDILNISILLLLRTSGDYKVFSDFVQQEYPALYKGLNKNMKFLFVKNFVAPFMINKGVRDLAYNGYLFFKNMRDKFWGSNLRALNG